MVSCCTKQRGGNKLFLSPIGNTTGAEPTGGDRGRLALGIWGDPVVSQSLVLLLRSSGYDVKFLPISSLSKLESLKGVQLLLLTPTPELGTERREALMAALKDMQGAAELLVLELVTSSEERQQKEARDESWRMVPWPLRVEELERWIENALLSNPRAHPKSYSVPQIWGEELEVRRTRTTRNSSTAATRFKVSD
jgi:hypothetical protein